ncbi:hypothetical protein [Lactobacillus sp. LL6]|uniref:hypothetical protein n=1 Tax=Lactobacillus sp. LL6 TaxID=2596827 RepID=UPI0011857D8C|nr:hypothetical protein [Lactobacillus sp. LL6]TSO25270.1 hypothetical protein FOD82_08505 [Lactobacillus sp. LL6]
MEQAISFPTNRVNGKGILIDVLLEEFKIFSVKINESKKLPSYLSWSNQDLLSDLITLYTYFDKDGNRNTLFVFGKENILSKHKLEIAIKNTINSGVEIEELDNISLLVIVDNMTLANQYNFLLNIMPNYLRKKEFSMDSLKTYGTAFGSNFYIQRSNLQSRKSSSSALTDKNGAYHFYKVYFINDERDDSKSALIQITETAFYPIRVGKLSKKLSKKTAYQILSSRLTAVDISNLNNDEIVYLQTPVAVGKASGSKPDNLAKAATLSVETDTRINMIYKILNLLNYKLANFLSSSIKLSKLKMKHITKYSEVKQEITTLPNFNFDIDLGAIKAFLPQNFDLEQFKRLFSEALQKADKKFGKNKMWNNLNFNFITRDYSTKIKNPTLMIVPNRYDIEENQCDPYDLDKSLKNSNLLQHIDIRNMLYPTKKDRHVYNFKSNNKLRTEELKNVLPSSLIELWYKYLRNKNELPAFASNNFKNWGFILLSLQSKLSRNPTIKEIHDKSCVVGGYIDNEMAWHEFKKEEFSKNVQLQQLAIELYRKYYTNRNTQWLIYDINDVSKYAFITKTNEKPMYEKDYFEKQLKLNSKRFNKEDVLKLISKINSYDQWELVPNVETFKQELISYIGNKEITITELGNIIKGKTKLKSKIISTSSGKKLSKLNLTFNHISEELFDLPLFISKSNSEGQFIKTFGGLLDINYTYINQSLLYCSGALNPQLDIGTQPTIYKVEGDIDIITRYKELLSSLLSGLIRFSQTSVINIAQKYLLQLLREEEYENQ